MDEARDQGVFEDLGPDELDQIENQRAPAARTGTLSLWVTLAYALVGVVGAACIVLSYTLVRTADDGVASRLYPELFLPGCVALLLALTVGPPTILLARRVSRGIDPSQQRMIDSFDELSHAFQTFQEQALLSDDARRVLNRQSERELLCRTIEQDIDVEDWDAGLVLCRELAERFGYRHEAEQYRARIELARSEVQERRVTDSIGDLDGLIVQRRWDDALRECARIQRLYPDSPRCEGLKSRVVQARTSYKGELERRFLEAAQQDDTDDAMDLLRELDSYLTQSEGERFQEVARGVIGRARENIGAQFKIAVHDRQWADAAAIGRRIINEFPNSRMSAEVRQLLDGILAKANATVETES